MNIVDELNNEFSKQKSLYKVGQQPVAELEKYKQIAMGYAEMENAVSVLSDMHTNVSYVYYGRFSQVFGWNRENGTEEKIDSIWEEKILKQIHPDDLRDKYLQELRFFHFVRRQPKTKRTDFYLANKLRIKDAQGNYQFVLHRLFYVPSPIGNSLAGIMRVYSMVIRLFRQEQGRSFGYRRNDGIRRSGGCTNLVGQRETNSPVDR